MMQPLRTKVSSELHMTMDPLNHGGDGHAVQFQTNSGLMIPCAEVEIVMPLFAFCPTRVDALGPARTPCASSIIGPLRLLAICCTAEGSSIEDLKASSPGHT